MPRILGSTPTLIIWPGSTGELSLVYMLVVLVTSSTDNVMNIQARITLKVAYEHVFFFFFSGCVNTRTSRINTNLFSMLPTLIHVAGIDTVTIAPCPLTAQKSYRLRWPGGQAKHNCGQTVTAKTACPKTSSTRCNVEKPTGSNTWWPRTKKSPKVFFYSCWWYSLCNFQYRQQYEKTCWDHFDC